jgi:hypothetical protein
MSPNNAVLLGRAKCGEEIPFLRAMFGGLTGDHFILRLHDKGCGAYRGKKCTCVPQLWWIPDPLPAMPN